MWDLALGAAVYVYNRTPHKSINYNTPIAKFAPNVSYDVKQIRRFGSLGYWTIPRKPESKFSARAVRGVMVGYLPTGYVLMNPETGEFFGSRNVDFNEKLVYADKYVRDAIQKLAWSKRNDRSRKLIDKFR